MTFKQERFNQLLALEKEYGSIKNVPEDDPRLWKLRCRYLNVNYATLRNLAISGETSRNVPYLTIKLYRKSMAERFNHGGGLVGKRGL